MRTGVTHLFDDREVIRFTESVLKSWIPSGRPILFVPCSKKKPVQDSPSHKKLFHRFRDACDMLILSEPMTVIPYDRFDYPAYDYPPGALWRIPGESDRFIQRLSTFLQAKCLSERGCFFLLTHHHLLILWQAWKQAFNDISGLDGYAYTHATRWFFVEKMTQRLD
ncbi:hypothetical protein EU520_00775 [Candidatus Thorarchaeota archaeon]|nr:MAG: hypothetical protein EU520_00775 [Candidatus Thorarchaeota archaeon]